MRLSGLEPLPGALTCPISPVWLPSAPTVPRSLSVSRRPSARIEGFLVLHFATPQPSRNRLRRSEPTPGLCDRCEKFFSRVTGSGAGEHDDARRRPSMKPVAFWPSPSAWVGGRWSEGVRSFTYRWSLPLKCDDTAIRSSSGGRYELALTLHPAGEITGRNCAGRYGSKASRGTSGAGAPSEHGVRRLGRVSQQLSA
jgi:hypothetical protein